MVNQCPVDISGRGGPAPATPAPAPEGAGAPAPAEDPAGVPVVEEGEDVSDPTAEGAGAWGQEQEVTFCSLWVLGLLGGLQFRAP